MGDVAIPGMIGPGDFSADQRPEDWTQGMLEIDPNGDVILTYLLSILPKSTTTDQKFHWHDRLSPSLTADLTNLYINSTLTTAYVFATHGATNGAEGGTLYAKLAEADAKMFRVGDQVLLRDNSDPDVDKNALVTGKALNGARSYLSVKMLEDDAVTDGTNSLAAADKIAGAGTGQGVGSPAPDAVTFAPTEYENYTQIYEESLDLSRTGLKTHLRTGDPYLDAKTLALANLLKKKERSYFFGARYADTDDKNKSRTFTGGIRWFLNTYASSNMFNFKYDSDYTAATWASKGEKWLDKSLEVLFRYGSDVKFGIAGPGVLLGLKEMAQEGGTYEVNSKTTSYGLRVMEFISPFGTILFKKHPDFIYDDVMRYTAFILDTKYMHEKVMDPIMHKKDPSRGKKGGANAVDGIKESFLGETGLMLRNINAHGMLQGFGQDNALTE